MSSSHHRSHSKRRKGPVKRFFSRLFGIKERHEHRSSFPGINLPRESDGEAMEKERDIPMQYLDDGSLSEIPLAGKRSRTDEKKLSSAGRIKRFFLERELRKEEKHKEKLKRKIRKAKQKRYRKEERGLSLPQKLIMMSEEGAEGGKRNYPLFSRHNPLLRNSSIIFNSTLIFISTYILTYLFYWGSELLMASFYGLDSTLYYYDLKFNDHSQLWTRFNILLITGLGPVLCLVLGTYLYKVLFRNSRFTGLQKLFILWLSFHMINHFFGAFPSGVVTDEGFGYVAAWLYMNTAFKFMFALVSLFVLGLIGYFSAERILETADSQSRIKAERRPSFILMQMILPWVIGTAILLLSRLPHNFDYPYETLMLFSIVFMIVPPIFNENVKPRLNMLRLKKRRNIHFGQLTMAVVLLAFLKIALGIGLHFIIHISISISPGNI
jgi:hypothetical protein